MTNIVKQTKNEVIKVFLQTAANRTVGAVDNELMQRVIVLLQKANVGLDDIISFLTVDMAIDSQEVLPSQVDEGGLSVGDVVNLG